MKKYLLFIIGLVFFVSIPAFAAPTVITSPATAVGQTTATLQGSFTSTTTSTDVRFEYGTTSALGSSTAYVTKSTSSGSFSAPISGLSPNTTYYFRAMAVDATGPAFGTTLSFTTTGTSMPKVITSPATTIGTTSATLRGSFDGVGQNTTTWFDYANNAQFTAASSTSKVASGTKGNISATVSGLNQNTTYYFRAMAQTSGGTAYGSPVLSFTTTTTPPAGCSIDSFSASPSQVTNGGSATLSWSTSNCTSASISGIGSVQLNGSTSTGTLTQTTTYTLSATGTNGSDTAQTTVTVSGTGTGGGACVISSFYASPASISYGQSTQLTWSTNNCTSVQISPTLGTQNTSGSVTTGALYGTTTYTLSASGTSGGFTNSQITVTVLGSGTGGGNTGGACSILHFSVSPTQVTNGQSATLSWSTSNCTSVQVSGGTLYGSQPLSASGIATGPLSGTTTFTIFATGNTNATRSETVYVTGGPYSYIYACSDGVDNDGDGLVDHPNDPGCYSTYDNDESNTVATIGTSNTANTSVITTAASNIRNGSARLNALVTNATFQTYGYFEYGTTTSLGNQTPTVFIGGGSTMNYFDTISVEANRTYYFRAVVQVGNTILRGSINSFNTGSVATGGTTTTSGSSTTTNTATTRNVFVNGSTSTNGILLAIDNGEDKVAPGQKVDYQIAYANNSGSTLTNTKLTIVLPQGFTALQATQGKPVAHNTVEVDLGTLTPGAQGNIFLQAQVDQNVPRNETLVTAVHMEYTLKGVADSSVAYVLNTANPSAALGGLALGSGFFPTTIFGWLITILIILAIIIVARRFMKKKK